MREKVIEKIFEEKIIVIVRGMAEEKILPLAEALYKGGIRLMEVTFNLREPNKHMSTAHAISSIAKCFGKDMLAGAGTVVTPELVDIACEAGALYIVSPNTDCEVISRTKEQGLVSIPGALTASECLAAANAGADFIKLFPAGELGVGYLKALKAPLSHLDFVATGGISDENIAEFLEIGVAGFGVGGSLVNKEWIAAGEFDKITDLARCYVEAIGVKRI